MLNKEIKYISANIVVPVTGNFIKNGIIAVDNSGTIKGVYQEHDPAVQHVDVVFYDGILVPGFINAHCHIELSHMLGRVERGTGLPKFLSTVMKMRDDSEEDIIEKMKEADRFMYNNGIQAVGDHVNTGISAAIKKESPIVYHTFVEVMGVNKKDVQERIDRARDVEFFFDSGYASITPHAPYSCAKELFKAFRKVISEENLLSIHNQESEEENKLFRYKEGGFLDFYKEMGMNIDDFKAQARNSVQSYLPHLPVSNRLILVHNTFTSLKDLDFISRQSKDVYFCLCPNANLYIEEKLPKILNFVPDHDRMLIGTDSLASNDSLDILSEMKVLVANSDDLNFLQVLKWATINGAKALGLSDVFGSIEVGKRPGLILLKGMHNLNLTNEVTLERIV